jgi:site-specific DNA recombinase
MSTTATYTRVSSREQQQEGFSLGAQSKLLTDYAVRNEFQVLKDFEDVETAKTSGRTQFNEMVAWFNRNRSCRTLLVEKTDRLYRNFRDYVTLEDLNIEIHLVKENQVISKDSKSQAKFIHGINLVVAKNYSDNLREEVKKGMREKASQGIYPGHAPFGYRNNKADRTIEVDPVDSPMVIRMMKLYATGAHTLSTLRDMLKADFGKVMSRGNIYLILKNRFYIGDLQWVGETFHGTHPLFVDKKTFERVQAVLAGHNRPKYSKRDVAFRGLMNCANDGCMLTGDVQKEKYVYYRCTTHRGKCNLPRFREEDIANRLGEPLKGLQVPPKVVAEIITTLQVEQNQAQGKLSAERTRLESRLTSIRNRMDAAYTDKLDGKIPEDLWERKMNEWRAEEQRVKMAIDGLTSAENGDRALELKEVFELANKAYYLYFTMDTLERADLLRKLCSNFSVDAVNTTPAYRYPFNLIYEKAKTKEWSGRLDSN